VVIGAIDFSVHADPGGSGAPYLKQAWGAFGAASSHGHVHMMGLCVPRIFFLFSTFARAAPTTGGMEPLG